MSSSTGPAEHWAGTGRGVCSTGLEAPCRCALGPSSATRDQSLALSLATGRRPPGCSPSGRNGDRPRRQMGELKAGSGEGRGGLHGRQTGGGESNWGGREKSPWPDLMSYWTLVVRGRRLLPLSRVGDYRLEAAQLGGRITLRHCLPVTQPHSPRAASLSCSPLPTTLGPRGKARTSSVRSQGPHLWRNCVSKGGSRLGGRQWSLR